MIYPLNNVRFAVHYEQGASGELRACGVALTDPEGWVEVAMPEEAVEAGAPPTVLIGVRVQRGEGGQLYVDADCIVVRGQPYRALSDLLAAGAGSWLAALGPAFDAEVERRIHANAPARSGRFARLDATELAALAALAASRRTG